MRGSAKTPKTTAWPHMRGLSRSARPRPGRERAWGAAAGGARSPWRRCGRFNTSGATRSARAGPPPRIQAPCDLSWPSGCSARRNAHLNSPSGWGAGARRAGCAGRTCAPLITMACRPASIGPTSAPLGSGLAPRALGQLACRWNAHLGADCSRCRACCQPGRGFCGRQRRCAPDTARPAANPLKMGDMGGNGGHCVEPQRPAARLCRPLRASGSVGGGRRGRSSLVRGESAAEGGSHEGCS